jgi:hypothetical protein
VEAEKANTCDYNTKDRPERSNSYMITQNVVWRKVPDEMRALLRDAITYGDLISMMRTSTYVQHLWTEYVAFIQANLGSSGANKYSMKMEISLNCKEKSKNCLHFHVALSNTLGKMVIDNSKRKWDYMGTPCFVVHNQAKGRSAAKCMYHNNYYCQVMKLGTIQTLTNWRAGIEHPVELSYIFGIWRSHKFSDEQARQQLHWCRQKGSKNFIEEIDSHRNWKDRIAEVAERLLLEARLPLRPSVRLPEVIDWLASVAHSFGNNWRQKFLVLYGPSKVGKTRYAVGLYGRSRSLVVSAQGQLTPDLKAFNRRVHDCIIFDEGDEKLVARNKQVFQATFENITLGQSPTMCATYERWLYGKAIIVCTNTWYDKSLSDEERAWIDSNSVVVSVREQLWMSDMSAIRMD